MVEPMGVNLRLGGFVILLILLLFGAEWIGLEWWAVGIGMGLLFFVLIASLPGTQPTCRLGWFLMALSAFILAVAWLVALFHDVPLSQLSSDRSMYRRVRRLPDYAMAAFTFSIATFVAVLLRRKQPPGSSKVRGK